MLDGKVAVVTGAGSGIGRAIATGFGEEGARVALLDINEDAAHAATEDVPDGIAIAVNVADEESVIRAFEVVRRDLGMIDVLVASAGVQLVGRDAAVHELTLDAWRATLDVNLTGIFLTAKHAVLGMLAAQRPGSIINVGSPTGLGGSGLGFHAYSASKGGVHALTRVMATEYASQGIRVNTLVPGATYTPLTGQIFDDQASLAVILRSVPMQRLGVPSDYVGAAIFLASDESAYATGATFVIDGGHSSR